MLSSLVEILIIFFLNTFVVTLPEFAGLGEVDLLLRLLQEITHLARLVRVQHQLLLQVMRHFNQHSFPLFSHINAKNAPTNTVHVYFIGKPSIPYIFACGKS